MPCKIKRNIIEFERKFRLIEIVQTKKIQMTPKHKINPNYNWTKYTSEFNKSFENIHSHEKNT